MAKKMKEDFKPVRIMEFNAWYLLFLQMIGLHADKKALVQKAQRYSDGSSIVYEGTMPVSLDSLKMWELCGQKADNGHMQPYDFGRQSALKCSDAIINVKFGAKQKVGIFFQLNEMFQAMSPDHLKKLCAESVDFQKIYEASMSNVECYRELKESEEIRRELNRAQREKAEKGKEKKEKEKNKKIEEIEGIIAAQKEKLKESLVQYGDAFECFLTDHLSQYDGTDENGSPKTLGYKVRQAVYENGFDVDTEDGVRRYRMYKRSASKAKQGNCTFIWEPLYEEMMDWTWLGLKFSPDQTYDLTSVKAYEALVQSSIRGTVCIDPESILLIDSVESPPIAANRRIFTKLEGEEGEIGTLLTEGEYEEIKGKPFVSRNKIWDGQALVDESVFRDAGYTKTSHADNRQGMMLLRNSFFKACAFHTRIQAYYRENGIKEVTDVFGRRMMADKVKMIVTLDSLKFVDKFADTFFAGEDAKVRAYDHWRKNISEVFGIVKEEHASNLGHGQYHEVSYQILNTLPLSKEDMEKLLKEDLWYLDQMKDNEAVLLHHIESASKSVVNCNYIYTFYKYFKDFERTEDFRNFRRDLIRKYEDRLRTGKIKLQGDFYVLCSMPMEMLEYSVHGNPKAIKPYLKRDRVYIKGLANGTDVTLFRYPHINSGSVCVATNSSDKRTGQIDKWFCFDHKDGSNIVVLSPWDSNVMAKLGGADFDSDTALFIKDPTVQRAARRLLEIKALEPDGRELPVAQADTDLVGAVRLRPYTPEKLAELDDELSASQAKIGKLSNDAQLFNSYLWKGYFEKREDGYLKKVYECAQALAVLNELEIDSTKHTINCDTEAMRKEIGKTYYNRERILEIKKSAKDTKVLCLPAFLAKEKGRKETDAYWDCPVDSIGRILDERKAGRRGRGSGILNMEEFFGSLQYSIEYDAVKVDRRRANKFKETVMEATRKLSALNDYVEEEETGSMDERMRIQEQCLAVLDKMRKGMDKQTVMYLFRAPFEKYTNYANTDKSRHKKGDYKNPELAEDSATRKRYLGFLAAFRSVLLEMIIPDTCRKTLTRSKERAIDSEKITIWGETYYYERVDETAGMNIGNGDR